MVFFISIQILNKTSVCKNANCGEPHSASDLVLHCSMISNKNDARLIRVKQVGEKR